MTHLEELFDYVGFTPADRERLRALHPVLAPHFPAVADRFYAAIWRNPGAASVLTGPRQIERLRVTLIDWMSSGLLGPHDEGFYDKRSRIGRRHVAIGLQQHYMFTAMNVVRVAYLEVVQPRGLDDVRAIEKLLDVELAIMVRHYQLDSEDQLLERERRNQVERMTAMQTMTAGIAHEVRNPLNSAKLQLELLERRLRRARGDDRLLEPCDLAQQEIERLTALLDDFLAFARPPELHLQAHDVAAIVTRVVELERVAAERRGVAIELVASAPQLARVDHAKLHQIVLNLVRNALEAVPAGGRVVVELAADDAGLVLRVTDDGGGIPDDARARIFEPFFSTKSTGTGLGMSIVQSLVVLHGGTITFDTSSRGTRFEVTIPRR